MLFQTFRSRSWLAFSALLLAPKLIAAADAHATARVSAPHHPVLIRNVRNDLLQIDVNVSGTAPVRVKAFEFSLEGTDDLGDLESCQVLVSGERKVFSTAEPWSSPVRPRARIRLSGDRLLQPGGTTFWLSCRVLPTADLLHQIVAKCLSIETADGTLVPENAAESARRRIGIALRRGRDDGVHTYRIPALTTTSRGTLLCVYDMRRRMGRDLQEDIDIGLSRSTDGGQSWEPVRVIMDMGEYGGLPQEQNGCSDPGIIVDRQSGEIFCFAVWMNGKPGKHQWNADGSEPGYEIGKTAQMMLVRSVDDGRTWSRPENLTRQLKPEAWWLLAPAPQQGFQLADGTLVMPAQGRDEQGKKFSTIMTSRDHGASWQLGTPAYQGGSECQAALLGDGSVMLNIRNDREKFRAVMVTSDLGATWQEHPTSRKVLIEPTCNGSLLRADYEADGERRHVLLFANPHSQTARVRQTIQVSFDDGQTWPASHHFLLDEGRGAGYPSLTQVDDRHIGIVYEGSTAHLVFEKFALAELLKGKGE